jgi:hypothetical protein
MEKLQTRLSRFSLALSLAVKIGLAAWLMATLLGSPTTGVALTPPEPQAVKARSNVEAVARRRKRLHRPAPEDETPQRERATDREPAGDPGPEPSASKPPLKRNAAPEPAAADRAAEDHREKTAAAEVPLLPVHPSPEANELPPVPDKWSDEEIIGALKECVEVLAPITAHVEISRPVREGQCGAPAPVLVSRVGAAVPVEISPPALVNCRMVAKLHEWVETVVQPAARETFNAPVRRLINASGYMCRNRNGGRSANSEKISEHALANAIDISTFVLADGRKLEVLGNWGQTERDRRAIAHAKAEAEKAAKAAGAAKPADKPGSEPSGKPSSKAPSQPAHRLSENDSLGGEPTEVPDTRARKEDVSPKSSRESSRRSLVSAEARSNLGGGHSVRDVPVSDATSTTVEAQFLRRLHRGACSTFGTVLGPEANEAHRNHFHLDLAPRRRSAFCE